VDVDVLPGIAAANRNNEVDVTGLAEKNKLEDKT
jgi:hypothetical protein